MQTFYDQFLTVKLYKYLTKPEKSIVLDSEKLSEINNCALKWHEFEKCVSSQESKYCQQYKKEFEKCTNQLN